MTETAKKPEKNAELQTIINKLTTTIKQVATEHGIHNVIPNQEPCGITLFIFYDKSVGHTMISLGDIDARPLIKYLKRKFPKIMTPNTQPDNSPYIN